MKSSLTILFFLLILFSAKIFSQGTLLFCEAVDNSGKANNSFESLILPANGQTIQLLYQTESGPFTTDKINLHVAKLREYKFQQLEQQSFEVSTEENKLIIPYKISSAGDYRFRLYDNKGELVAEEILSVSVETYEHGGISESREESNDLDLPENSDIYFSERNSDQYNTEFSFRASRGIIRITLQPFDPSDPVRLLDIWQNENNQFKKFIRTERVTFTIQGNNGICELPFPGIADYKVDVHTSGNVLITSGFVSFK